MKNRFFGGKGLVGVYGNVGIYRNYKYYTMSRKTDCESPVVSHIFTAGNKGSVNFALTYIEATEAEKKAILRRYG